ncbi:MAG: beta-lactamase family protein [Defluviitaleaceae bacterium]|nr:beta-lactamase family protein [Defluviitaleaceae bacterium]
MAQFKKTAECILKGIDDEVFPCAALALGDKEGEKFRIHAGFSALYPEKSKLTEDTLFDLASVTKIMSTTMVALKLIESGELGFRDKISKYFDTPMDKKDITIYNLLTHTAGMPRNARVEEMAKSPEDIVQTILSLEFSEKSGAAYTCLGYIVLGKICEGIKGRDLSILAKEMIFEPLGLKNTMYNPDKSKYSIVTTEYKEKYGCHIHGSVHDEKARFLNGIAGNAGLFSDISDCSIFAAMLANKGVVDGKEFLNRDLFNESIKNHTKHLSDLSESRGYGFFIKDSDPSPAGDIFPIGSYGHTGFSGTSIWVDKDTSQYIVLLSNRIHPSRENMKIQEFRTKLHTICAEEYRASLREIR